MYFDACQFDYLAKYAYSYFAPKIRKSTVFIVQITLHKLSLIRFGFKRILISNMHKVTYFAVRHYDGRKEFPCSSTPIHPDHPKDLEKS